MTIQLVGLTSGEPHEMSGQWIVSYDADYHLPGGEYDGGALICTRDRTEATEFSLLQVFELLASGPKCKCHRRRPDGEPNRPLCAFDVSVNWEQTELHLVRD